MQNKALTENTKNVLVAPLSDSRTETKKIVPELVELCNRWDDLPENTRRAVLLMAGIEIEKTIEK